MQKAARMKRELAMFADSPPFGISCWSKDSSLEHLEAQIVGGDCTPYKGGIFKLEITIPERYPFEPPKVQFLTPIYHPNIDSAGRICLDSLKMPPKGAWRPALNMCTLLTTIQLLMAEPNPDDPLMTDIANEFKYNRPQYEMKAKDWTQQHAVSKSVLTCSMENSSVETRDQATKECIPLPTEDQLNRKRTSIENQPSSVTDRNKKIKLN